MDHTRGCLIAAPLKRRVINPAKNVPASIPKATFVGSGTDVMSRLQPCKVALPPPAIVSAKYRLQVPFGLTPFKVE